jgi:hypothetical protein
MSIRSLARFATLVLAASCGGRNPAAPLSVPGPYWLVTLDGNALPCCAYTDSSGSTIALNDGLLILFLDSTYSWRLENMRTNGDTRTVVPVSFSSGRWQWDGTTLTLSDSDRLGTIRSTFSDSSITLQAGTHRYEFHRLRCGGTSGLPTAC